MTFQKTEPKVFLVSRNLRKTLIWIANKEPYHGIVHLLPCFTLASSCTFWIRSAWVWYRVFPLGSPTLYMPLGYGTPSRVPWPPANSKTATLSCEICSNPEHRSLLCSLQYMHCYFWPHCKNYYFCCTLFWTLELYLHHPTSEVFLCHFYAHFRWTLEERASSARLADHQHSSVGLQPQQLLGSARVTLRAAAEISPPEAYCFLPQKVQPKIVKHGSVPQFLTSL